MSNEETFNKAYEKEKNKLSKLSDAEFAEYKKELIDKYLLAKFTIMIVENEKAKRE